ncbi:Rad17 cell cycle checkpoint protein-domain-containing protein [Irpex rosettiformis]|uniref:Rad17 cell cycle checkpoint protein-domain-containing protein n=1 Tax=Irpex rosettiformis TaxID=378272 RepID=A0ACB8TSE4_9APHY|nr:Rad17 cell cycle checkpoint protein-domain-containing protein [Irpex rosettiformis]
MAPSSYIISHRERKTSSQLSQKRASIFDSEPSSSKKQRLKPLSALSKPPVFDLTGSQSNLSQSSKPTVKGKAKAYPQALGKSEDEDVTRENGTLWIDMYEPTTEAELAVHIRKVNDVKQWLREAFEGGPSGKLRKYRKVLALTGPAGTAKTTTLRVLSHELDFSIMEWRNSVDERFHKQDEYDEKGNGLEYEGLSDKFHAFLSRATSSNSILSATKASSSYSYSPSSSQRPLSRDQGRRVVLLEDLPNILHPPTQTAFQSSLYSAVMNQGASFPIVIVISDAGARGESDSDGLPSQTWKGKGREVVDIRTVLPPSLLHSPYVTQISFNAIAPTLMKRALQNIVSTHFSTTGRKGKCKQPSKEVIDLITETSNGDIRSAIMSLQFAYTTSATEFPLISSSKGAKGRSKKSEKAVNSRALLEVTSRREQNLVLFHLLGKILYNKRKGDLPSSSASARDVQREKEIDMQLNDPPRLPSYLSEHDRRASRVDVEALYSDTPIDASLLSLYIQQNYTQYCNTLDECDGVIDWLSWVDSSGGESWLQANPHQFHLVTLGTLHSLPSPVTRRGQKPYKPEFFDNLKGLREGEDGLRDVQEWLHRHETLGASWTRNEIALEMGSVLKAYDMAGSTSFKPPHTHRKFSRLEFVRGTTTVTDPVDDKEVTSDLLDVDGDGEERRDDPEKAPGGWLESDDIEDW